MLVWRKYVWRYFNSDFLLVLLYSVLLSSCLPSDVKVELIGGGSFPWISRTPICFIHRNDQMRLMSLPHFESISTVGLRSSCFIDIWRIFRDTSFEVVKYCVNSITMNVQNVWTMGKLRVPWLTSHLRSPKMQLVIKSFRVSKEFYSYCSSLHLKGFLMTLFSLLVKKWVV